MPLLRFTNPASLPVYAEWDFEVQPSLITLRMEDLRDAYAAYCENHRRYHSSIPKEWPRYAEYLQVSRLQAELDQACLNGRDVEINNSRCVWAYCSELMFEKQFVCVACPACGKEYLPSECAVKEWAYGKDLAASGGRRVVCPGGHTVYSRGEWVS
jgi:hypothetical protein